MVVVVVVVFGDIDDRLVLSVVDAVAPRIGRHLYHHSIVHMVAVCLCLGQHRQHHCHCESRWVWLRLMLLLVVMIVVSLLFLINYGIQKWLWVRSLSGCPAPRMDSTCLLRDSVDYRHLILLIDRFV